MTKSPNKVKRLNRNNKKTKRDKNELTVAQKYEVIRYRDSNPGIKQTALIKYFNDVYKLEIPKQTMSDILSDKTRNKILKLDDVENDFNIRIRDAKYPDLEECLYTWQKINVKKHIPISDDMLIEKAKDFGVLFGVRDFNYSLGWLVRFKARYGLTQQTIIGESGSVDKEQLEIERVKLKKLLEAYKPEDIYNLDECALFYKLPPNKTIADKSDKLEGVKLSKDRISVAFTVNSTGDDYIKPIVIGHIYDQRSVV